MNLAKAKIVLIIAFLGLNLFLSYQLFWPTISRLTRTVVSIAELRQAENQLEQANYYLEAPLSRAIQKSAFLTVSPLSFETRRFIEKATSELTFYGKEEEVSIYRAAEREARIYPSGLINLTYQPGYSLPQADENQGDEALMLQVDQFLMDHGLKPRDSQFDFIEKREDGSLVFHYFRSFDGHLLFSSYIEVTVNELQVTAVEIFWLKPIAWPQERTLEVVPAVEALLSLVEDLGSSSQPRRIVRADLGFYSKEYDAERWEMPPVWRFMLDNQEIFYVNAFTGNQETRLPTTNME